MCMPGHTSLVHTVLCLPPSPALPRTPLWLVSAWIFDSKLTLAAGNGCKCKTNFTCCWRNTVQMILGRVEEWEAGAVSNGLSVSLLCLFCVSKSTFTQRSAKVRMEEWKGMEEATQTVLRKWGKYKEDWRRESQFFQYPQTLLFPSITSRCSKGVQKPNERPENENNMTFLRFALVNAKQSYYFFFNIKINKTYFTI